MENQPETKKCPSCQMDVSTRATKCPHCQSDLRNWFQKHPLITILLVIIILPSIFSTAFSSPKKENSVKQSESEKPQPTISVTKQKMSEDASLREGQILGKYNYTIGQKTGDTRLVAMFDPFLPRDDKVLTSAMHELVNQNYGKNIDSNLEPKLVSRDGTNLIMLKSASGNYLFMPFKEDSGEVNALVFWMEEAGDSNTFNASVRFTGTQFVIANLSDIDCVNANMEVNSGFLSGGYTFEGDTLIAGQTYTVGALQFAKGEKRLNPLEIKPKSFYLHCGGSNTLGGASWYGSFE